MISSKSHNNPAMKGDKATSVPIRQKRKLKFRVAICLSATSSAVKLKLDLRSDSRACVPTPCDSHSWKSAPKQINPKETAKKKTKQKNVQQKRSAPKTWHLSSVWVPL